MADPELHRIKEVFCAALEKPPAQRDTFLEAACAGDRALRKKVERSLAAYERAGEFLAEPTEVSIAEMLLGVAAAAPLPERIGQYHVTRIIASGGMGVVYEAVQAHPHRTVALKVMRGGIASPSALRRFDHESQILARLRHPNIAQIYESGTHDDPAAGGAPVPYFAMEYIPNAKNLLEYAHEENLSSRQRLKMFTKVCEAVHHGHQKGIIHRDLKPGNILVEVTESGRAGNGRFDLAEPKIIDFGVARATDSDVAVTTLQTDIGQLIGTLQYMSPEQCKADPHDLDSRSDIYALGVVLYQLLCGQLPYDLTRLPVLEAARVIRDESPAKPSTINRTLRGDLETIVLKALEKDRTRRYQSASDLARDITRYLDDEPILARPPSAAYQFRKFVKRNKALAGGITVAFVALVLGTVVATWQAVRALAAEQLTQAEATKAVAVKDFLAGMIGATDFVEAGQRLSVVDVLDQAVQGIEGVFADQPELEAEIRHLIGLSYASMSEHPKSIAQLQLAFEIRKRTLGEDHEHTLESAHGLGERLRQNWQWAEAESVLRWVVEARRRKLGENHRDTLVSISRLAKTLQSFGKIGEAEPLARRAVDGLTGLLGEEDIQTLRAREVLTATLYANGRVAESLATRRGTVDICRRALGEEHWLTLHALRELGAVYYVEGQWEKAEPLLRSTLEARQRLFGNDDIVSLYWLETFGWMLHRNGNTAEGGPLLRHGAEQLRRVYGERNLKTLYAMRRLGYLEWDLGNLEAAEELLRRCLALQREALGENHAHPPESMSDLGWLLRQRQKLDEAESLLRQALKKQRAIIGEEHREPLVTMYRLGVVLSRQGPEQYAEAESVLHSTYSGRRELSGEEHPDTQAALAALIDLYEAWGKPDKAAEWRAKLAATGE